jgi:hypothetical protein
VLGACLIGSTTDRDRPPPRAKAAPPPPAAAGLSAKAWQISPEQAGAGLALGKPAAAHAARETSATLRRFVFGAVVDQAAGTARPSAAAGSALAAAAKAKASGDLKAIQAAKAAVKAAAAADEAKADADAAAKAAAPRGPKPMAKLRPMRWEQDNSKKVPTIFCK